MNITESIFLATKQSAAAIKAFTQGKAFPVNADIAEILKTEKKRVILITFRLGGEINEYTHLTCLCTIRKEGERWLPEKVSVLGSRARKNLAEMAALATYIIRQDSMGNIHII